MYKFYKLFFFFMLIQGTLIAITAYSWMAMWIGLEINLLSIIPLFKSTHNKYPAESTLKYFITQAMASSIILFIIILLMNVHFYINYWLILIMNSAFLLKLGAAPFHFWLPEVAEGLNWFNNLLLLTWQKIAPMILIMYNLKMTWFFSMIAIISTIIGGVYGFNQVSLRKILAYSSINHLGWMISSMLAFKSNWIIYFNVYIIIISSIIFIFYIMNIYYLNQLLMILNYDKLMKMTFIMNFLSLGGLPPFLGFFPKWLVINSLIASNFYSLTFILIVFNLLTLFVYTRIIFFTLTINFKENFIWLYKHSSQKFLILNIITLFGFFICMNLFSIF